VATKEWHCPACQRTFIVAEEARQDTCPWCGRCIIETEGRLVVQTPTSPSAQAETPGPEITC